MMIYTIIGMDELCQEVSRKVFDDEKQSLSLAIKEMLNSEDVNYIELHAGFEEQTKEDEGYLVPQRAYKPDGDEYP